MKKWSKIISIVMALSLAGSAMQGLTVSAYEESGANDQVVSEGSGVSGIQGEETEDMVGNVDSEAQEEENGASDASDADDVDALLEGGVKEEAENEERGETQTATNGKELSEETQDPEEEYRANSWRYKDGEPIASQARYTEYSTWPTNVSGAVAYGIDVSEWQGNIDWAKAKKAGVDYAIIRCGYGSNYVGYDDKKWYANADACVKNGIPFGTYLYSYADSVVDAKSEAQHVLRLVAGYDMDYPIYYDLEDNVIPKDKVADIAEAFCDIIEEAGYEVAIYANTNWFENYLTDSRFDQWDKWVAQYNTTCTYKGNYSMWQCSSKGRVNGISGNVDLNVDLGASERRIEKSNGKIYGYQGSVKLYGAQKIDGYWYYFDKNNGGAAWIGFRADGSKKYYYDEEGRLLLGVQKIEGYWYYFSSNGSMYTGWREDGDQTYYYDEAGHLVLGVKKIDGYWYYFSSNGNMYTGWRKDGNQTYYYDEAGHLLLGAQKIEDYWYYFSSNGNMYTGWREDGQKRYYYDETGRLALDVKKIDGYWYYFSSNGNMYTGWREDGDKIYYYNEEGHLTLGVKQIEDYWYYFSSNGNMYTGWREDGDKTYYYDEAGHLALGVKKIEGYWYYFSSNGNMYTGWRTENGKTYYYDQNGHLAQKGMWIDGKWYEFKSNGELVK